MPTYRTSYKGDYKRAKVTGRHSQHVSGLIKIILGSQVTSNMYCFVLSIKDLDRKRAFGSVLLNDD